MKSSGILGLRPAMFLLALCAGGLVGGLAYWPDSEESQEAKTAVAPPAAGSRRPATNPSSRDVARSAPTPSRGATGPPADPEREIGQVFAAPGLRFDPVHDGDVFVGYRVLENESDPRFHVGDVIVSINGRPVEGSAAGGELLIAALNDSEASVGTRDATTQ